MLAVRRTNGDNCLAAPVDRDPIAHLDPSAHLDPIAHRGPSVRRGRGLVLRRPRLRNCRPRPQATKGKQHSQGQGCLKCKSYSRREQVRGSRAGESALASHHLARIPCEPETATMYLARRCHSASMPTACYNANSGQLPVSRRSVVCFCHPPWTPCKRIESRFPSASE